MKKGFLVIFLLLFLVGCNKSITTLETTSDYTYIVNQDIVSPEVQVVDNTITLEAVEGATEYMIVATDTTTLESTRLLPNQTFHLTDTLVFNLNDLINNRVYDINIYTVSGEEISSPTVISNYYSFAALEDIELTYNINNLDDLYVYGYLYQDVYMVDEDSLSINQDYFQLETSRLYINHDYLVSAQNTYDDILVLTVYTATGEFDLTITFQDVTKPYIVSSNEVVFNGSDLEFVFDYCGGEFDQISGNDISSENYFLNNNVLTIDAGYIQNLFDNDTERETVVLNYTLRNDTDIVLGAIVINKN